MACAGIVTATATARAVNGDGTSPFATYNMQGSNNGERWSTEVRQLAADNAVVALQEVGSGPPLPARPDRSNFRQIRLNPPRPAPLPGSVTQTTWPGGPDGSDRYVYFLQTDPRRDSNTGRDRWEGGRVNLATVTDSPADEVRVLENPHYDPDPDPSNNRYRARPLLGLRFGNTWYWNAHARGHDVRPLLDQVRNVAAGDGRNWALAGDFNLDILGRSDEDARDTSLHLRSDEALARTHQATYIGGDRPSELDYAVTHGLTGFHAAVPQGRGSDHAPVYFGRTAPPSRLPTPSQTYGTVLSTPTGRLLQENPDDSFTVADAGYGNNQTFQMYTTGALDHYIENLGTHDCIAIAAKVRRDASSRTVAGDCGDPRAQWSVSELKSEEGELNQDYGRLQRWRNVASPGLCLAREGSAVTAAPCTDDDSQGWRDVAAAPAKWLTAKGNARLESEWFGGRVRRAGAVSGTGIYKAPVPPKSSWIYWLLWERQDFGWEIQRVNPSGNLVRLKSEDGDEWCLGSRDEHAGTKTDALLRTCDEDRGVNGAGQLWLAETFPDGSLRFRNEANNLCLESPDADRGNVHLYECLDYPAQRWSVVNP